MFCGEREQRRIRDLKLHQHRRHGPAITTKTSVTMRISVESPSLLLRD